MIKIKNMKSGNGNKVDYALKYGGYKIVDLLLEEEA